MYRLLARIGLFALVVLLFGGAAVARADEASPPTGVSVVPGDNLVLSQPTSAGPATATITIGNGTDQPIEVRLTAVLRDKDAKKVTPSTLSGPETLDIGDVEEFEIGATGVDDGVVLVTAVAASDKTQVAVVELPVSTVTEDDSKAPQPAVSEWKVTQGTWGTGRLSSWVQRRTAARDEQPVTFTQAQATKKDCLDLKSDAKGQGDEVTCVRMNIPQKAECSQWTSQDLVLAGSSGSVPARVICNLDGQLQVSYASDGIRPGLYSGTVKFGDAELAVTLTQQRPFWTALLLAASGMLLVWIATSLWTIVGPLARAHGRLRAAESETLEATKQRIKGNPPRPEIVLALRAMSPDVGPELARVASYMKPKIIWPLVAVLPSAAAAELDKAVGERQQDATHVDSLVDALETLDARRQGLVPNKPLRKQADRFFATAPGWKYRGAETIAKISALTQVAILRADLKKIKDIAVSLGGPLLPEAERAALRVVRAEIERLSELVDDADDAAALLTGGLVESVRAVRANCTALFVSVNGEALANELGGTTEGAVPPQVKAVIEGGLLIPGLSQMLDGLTKAAAVVAGGVAPWLLYLITAVVAFYAGLEAFYFDKPWGTGRDYIAAFIYGATVLAVSLSLGTFFSKRGQKEG